jgi:hypothetical protein
MRRLIGRFEVSNTRDLNPVSPRFDPAETGTPEREPADGPSRPGGGFASPPFPQPPGGNGTESGIPVEESDRDSTLHPRPAASGRGAWPIRVAQPRNRPNKPARSGTLDGPLTEHCNRSSAS